MGHWHGSNSSDALGAFAGQLLLTDKGSHGLPSSSHNHWSESGNYSITK